MSSLIITFSIMAAIFSSLFWVFLLLPDVIDRPSPKRYGILFLLAAVFVFGMIYTKTHNMLPLFTSLFPLQVFFSLSMFPLAYLFFHTLTNRGALYQHQYLKHFIIPLGFTIMIAFFIYVGMDVTEKESFIAYHLSGGGVRNIPFDPATRTHWLGSLFYVFQIIAYTYLIRNDYKAHLRQSQDMFSNKESADLPWLVNLSYLYLLVFIAHMTSQLAGSSFISEHHYIRAFSYVSFAFLAFFSGFYINSQRQLFHFHIEDFDALQAERKKAPLIKKQDIEKYFMEHKPFLNPDYSLYDMGIYFAVNRTCLSNLINNEFGMNFRSFVNIYRLKEAKSLIEEEVSRTKDISLEYIAAKSGFNTYTTFSRVFKEETGKSPRQFRDALILQ